MKKDVLTYFIIVLYLCLFQIYPFIHVHGHQNHEFKVCYTFETELQTPNAEYNKHGQCNHTHVKADYHHSVRGKDVRLNLVLASFFTHVPFYNVKFEFLKNQSVLFRFIYRYSHYSNKSPPATC